LRPELEKLLISSLGIKKCVSKKGNLFFDSYIFNPSFTGKQVIRIRKKFEHCKFRATDRFFIERWREGLTVCPEPIWIKNENFMTNTTTALKDILPWNQNMTIIRQQQYIFFSNRNFCFCISILTVYFNGIKLIISHKPSSPLDLSWFWVDNQLWYVPSFHTCALTTCKHGAKLSLVVNY
jgi:hypothetical protein